MLLFCPVLPNVPTAHKIHHKRYQRRNFQITVFQIKTNLSTIRFICFTQNVLDALDQMHWMPQIQSQKLDFFFTELPLALPSLTAPRTVIFTVIKKYQNIIILQQSYVPLSQKFISYAVFKHVIYFCFKLPAKNTQCSIGIHCN